MVPKPSSSSLFQFERGTALSPASLFDGFIKPKKKIHTENFSDLKIPSKSSSSSWMTLGEMEPNLKYCSSQSKNV